MVVLQRWISTKHGSKVKEKDYKGYVYTGKGKGKGKNRGKDFGKGFGFDGTSER